MDLIEGLRRRVRSFVLGPAVVDPWATQWGSPASVDFQPTEYGDYITTSGAVYACITLRAQLLASLPLRFYRKGRRPPYREEVWSGPLVDLLSSINPHWTPWRLWYQTEQALGLWGEAFWFLDRGPGKKMFPMEIWWGRPDRVRVVPDKNRYIKGFLYQSSWSGETLAFEPDEVIWIPKPNPLNEFEGLSPIAASRIYADYESASMKANRNLHAQGVQLGGIIGPKEGVILSTEQAAELERQFERRFTGVDRAHRWAVLRSEFEAKELGVTPKDAEFLGGLRWSLESVCRAYQVPLDLVGGERTYENVKQALRMVWTNAILPEATFLAAELTEQLLPMFPGQADVVEFDTSGVEVLQEEESARWDRERQQIEIGALTLNEWREAQGKEKLAWGDVWWAPMNKAAVSSEQSAISSQPSAPSQGQAPQGQAVGDESPGGNGDEVIEGDERSASGVAALPGALSGISGNGRGEGGGVEFGSEEHEILWRRFVRRTDRDEGRFGEVVAELFRRLGDSVLDRLKEGVVEEADYKSAAHEGKSAAHEGGGGRSPEGAMLEPFSMGVWVKRFREGVRPELGDIVEDSGSAALEDLGLAMAFDVKEPLAVQFLEDRTQRFAERVTETTWKELQGTLAEGINGGESIKELSARVEGVMGERIRSSATTIARTEVVGASNGGTLLGWQQSEVVTGKRWLSALDERTRESHVAAHGQTVGVDEDFVVGAGRGPMPGQMGVAGEDVNCRCTATAVLE